ncbi:MAG: hypothetical protein JST68_16160 [Bacteroidetes bacterium]|nr:hypothetical protein [Bacteroidota bacterium]
MITETKIISEAIERLKDYSGLPIEIEEEDSLFLIKINNNRFLTVFNAIISNGNKVSVYSRLSPNKTKYPLLIIAGYIPQDIAREYAQAGVNYLDVAGNCHIRYKNLAIVIEGKKRERVSKTNQSRAFQEAGIKIIFQLLNDSSNLNLPYRELAKISNVSLGSVGSVMKELGDLGFILETQKKRTLKNTSLLVERWVTAYNDVLRPRLILKKMKYTGSEQYRNWDGLPIQDADDVVLWGGEPAASLLTSYLSPEQFVLYTNGSWQGLMRDLKLIPDDNGNIEVLEMFWEDNAKPEEKHIVPALLIYADLMGSRIGRNVETAKLILENELSNIVGRL